MTPPTSHSRRWVVPTMLFFILSASLLPVVMSGVAVAAGGSPATSETGISNSILEDSSTGLLAIQQDEQSSENETDDEDEDEGDDESGLLKEIDFPEFPDPGEWVIGALEALTDRALEGIQNSINLINDAFVGLPAPGEPTSPATWDDPENGWWPGVYKAMNWSQAIGIIWLTFQSAISFSYNSQSKRRESWKRQGIAWLLVLGSTFFAPLGLHLFGELASDIVPQGAEFTQSFTDFSRFGVGVIFAALLVFLATNVVALGLIAIFMIYVLAHIAVLFWPIMWAAWSSSGQARSYGSMGIYIYGTLLALSLIQAMFLLVMFHIPWDQGPMGPLGGLLGITAGLLFALVYFPIMMLKQAHIAAAVGLGAAAANSADQALKGPKAAVADRVEQKYEQVWKERNSSGGVSQSRPDLSDRPQVGRVSTSGGSNPGSGSGRGTATRADGKGGRNSRSQRGVDAADVENEQDRINRMYQ